MQLKPLDSPELIRLAAGWLAEKGNYQWLDFGDGRQLVSPEWLKIAMQRGTHVLRIFTSDATTSRSGWSASANVNPHFRTGNFWVVLGDKAYAGQGYASRATSQDADARLPELGLRAIQTWIVATTRRSHVAARVKFRPDGHGSASVTTSTARRTTGCGSTCCRPNTRNRSDVRRNTSC